MDKKPVCRSPTAHRIRNKTAANDNVAVHWRADWLAVHQLVLQNVCQQSPGRSPTFFAYFKVQQKLLMVGFRQDRSTPESGRHLCKRTVVACSWADTDCHDFSSDGTPSSAYRNARRPREDQQANMRLNHPGTRAVQQGKPKVVCMRYHTTTVGTLRAEVNRSGLVKCGPAPNVSRTPAARRLRADPRRDYGTPRLQH